MSERIGNVPQHFVTDRVAIDVVDLFEVVEVDHHDADRQRVDSVEVGSPHPPRQTLAIRQTSEWITCCGGGLALESGPY